MEFIWIHSGINIYNSEEQLQNYQTKIAKTHTTLNSKGCMVTLILQGLEWLFKMCSVFRYSCPKLLLTWVFVFGTNMTLCIGKTPIRFRHTLTSTNVWAPKSRHRGQQSRMNSEPWYSWAVSPPPGKLSLQPCAMLQRLPSSTPKLQVQSWQKPLGESLSPKTR